MKSTHSDSKAKNWPDFPNQGGTYVLWLHHTTDETRTVGRLGTFAFPRGWYAYVGSAFGPGGLAARLRRHLQHDKTKHWHIDYLSDSWPIKTIWLCAGTRAEHQWATFLAKMPRSKIVAKGLGSSDCRCKTHLFRFPTPLPLSRLQDLEGCPIIVEWASRPLHVVLEPLCGTYMLRWFAKR